METTKRYRATGLSEVIAAQGRTREWIAAQGRVHPSLVTHLLAGRRTISEEVADRIANGLGVPLFLLFELSDGRISMPAGRAA